MRSICIIALLAVIGLGGCVGVVSQPSMLEQHLENSVGYPALPRKWRQVLVREPIGATAAPVAATFAMLELAQRETSGVRYVSDLVGTGADDAWLTPGEFMARGGDCEDFAIAKYYWLRRRGVSAEHLRVVVGHKKDRALVLVGGSRVAPHAVLTVRVEGSWHVLDNVHPRVLRAQEMTWFIPVGSFNEQFVFVQGRP